MIQKRAQKKPNSSHKNIQRKKGSRNVQNTQQFTQKNTEKKNLSRNIHKTQQFTQKYTEKKNDLETYIKPNSSHRNTQRKK